MAVQIIHKHSESVGSVPAATALLVGEIAVNAADKKWFTKTTAGSVVCLNQLTALDGGETTGFVELVTNAGENIVDANGNAIGFQ